MNDMKPGFCHGSPKEGKMNKQNQSRQKTSNTIYWRSRRVETVRAAMRSGPKTSRGFMSLRDLQLVARNAIARVR